LGGKGGGQAGGKDRKTEPFFPHIYAVLPLKRFRKLKFPDNFVRVVKKLKFLNNNRLKATKCGAFCRICSGTNRVLEQVYYKGALLKRQFLKAKPVPHPGRQTAAYSQNDRRKGAK
jgi:hypothetical protein